VDADGRPSGRYVLLKGVDQRGFVFYTNVDSRKARALAANPYGLAVFLLAALDKAGSGSKAQVERVTDAEADSYFSDTAARVTDRRVGLRAKRVLESSTVLDERVRGDSPAIWRRRCLAPAVLVRLPRDTDRRLSSGRATRRDCTGVSGSIGRRAMDTVALYPIPSQPAAIASFL
jgi:hypothetical protein